MYHDVPQNPWKNEGILGSPQNMGQKKKTKIEGVAVGSHGSRCTKNSRSSRPGGEGRSVILPVAKAVGKLEKKVAFFGGKKTSKMRY